MNKTTKSLLICLCAVMLVIGSVFGTLAYLTDSDSAVNTFTVGNADHLKKFDGTCFHILFCLSFAVMELNYFFNLFSNTEYRI